MGGAAAGGWVGAAGNVTRGLPHFEQNREPCRFEAPHAGQKVDDKAKPFVFPRGRTFLAFYSLRMSRPERG